MWPTLGGFTTLNRVSENGPKIKKNNLQKKTGWVFHKSEVAP